MIRQRATHWLLVVGVFLIPPCAANAGAVRIALVGSHGAGVAGGVVALAEVQLSSPDGLEVLDR